MKGRTAGWAVLSTWKRGPGGRSGRCRAGPRLSDDIMGRACRLRSGCGWLGRALREREKQRVQGQEVQEAPLRERRVPSSAQNMQAIRDDPARRRPGADLPPIAVVCVRRASVYEVWSLMARGGRTALHRGGQRDKQSSVVGECFKRPDLTAEPPALRPMRWPRRDPATKWLQVSGARF